MVVRSFNETFSGKNNDKSKKEKHNGIEYDTANKQDDDNQRSQLDQTLKNNCESINGDHTTTSKRTHNLNNNDNEFQEQFKLKKNSETTSKKENFHKCEQQEAQKPQANSPRPLKFEPPNSLLPIILIHILSIILVIYDYVSLPIYFAIQRPDKRHKLESARIRSHKIDKNTWRLRNSIDIDFSPKQTNFSRTKNSTKSKEAEPNNHDNSLGTNIELASASAETHSNVIELFLSAIDRFSDRRCLGYRAVVCCPPVQRGSSDLYQNDYCGKVDYGDSSSKLISQESFRSDYTWYTYEQVGRRVQDIVFGMYQYSFEPGWRALFIASTGAEWFCAAQACLQFGIQILAAPGLLDDEKSLHYIISHSKCELLFVSCQYLQKVCELLETLKSDSSKLHKIIMIDWQISLDFSEPAFARLRDCSREKLDQLLILSQLEEAGAESISSHHALRNLKAKIWMTRGPSQLDGDNDPAIEKLPHNQQEHQLQFRPTTAKSMKKFIPKHRRSESSFESTRFKAKYELPRQSVIDNADHQCSLNLLLHNHVNYAKASDIAFIVYKADRNSSGKKLKAVRLVHGYLSQCSQRLFLNGLVCDDEVYCTTLALDNALEFITELCIVSRGGCIGYSSNLETLVFDGRELLGQERSDLEMLNPTFLLTQPYVLERLRESVQNYLRFQVNPLKSILLTKVLHDYKRYWKKFKYSTPIVDAFYCNNLRRLFGRDLRYIICDGRTDCKETKDFFTTMLNVPVIEIYAPNEALVSLIPVSDEITTLKEAVTKEQIMMHEPEAYNEIHASHGLDGELDMAEYKTLFVSMEDLRPFTLASELSFENDSTELPIDYKRESRPGSNNNNSETRGNSRETNRIVRPGFGTLINLEDRQDFKTTDEPYPCGRLLIGGDVLWDEHELKSSESKSNSITSCQLSTPVTEFDPNTGLQWFKTNDIVRVLPNGTFEILSGVTDMIRSSDGQFISLSQIEQTIKNNQFIDNVCALFIEEPQLFIVIVTPNLGRLALKMANNYGAEFELYPDLSEINDLEFRREVCNDRHLSEFLCKQLKRLVRRIPGARDASQYRFTVVPEIWTYESGLATASFEPKREAIREFYKYDIRSLVLMQTGSTKPRLRDKLQSTFTSASQTNGGGFGAANTRRLTRPNKLTNKRTINQLARWRVKWSL